jgi:hypothetical protein
MLRERRRFAFGIAGLFAAGAAIPNAAAQYPIQKVPPKEPNIGEKEVEKLLLLMDKDKNGKVSKQEFMSFMEAEFDRLDQDKSGELDVKELTRSQVRTSGAVHR